VATADIGDPSSIARAVKGHDAVVSAVTDRTTDDRSIIPRTARTLLEVLPEAGVKRLVVVAQPDSSWAVSASASRRSRECVASPHHLVPGEKTGAYRVQAGDTPVIDESGDSRITAGDFAAALVDELENPRFVRQRFTAAY
jgi:putative NADH-flavin reductase